jgi:peroxiredoxin Q/BCP
MSTLTIGDKIPALEASDQTGALRNLNEFIGKPFILYFYPKDLTPGCTMQACSLRDAQQDLLNLGYAVVGVSADTVNAHARFTEKKQLNFTLLADVDKKIINAFGVWGSKKFMGREYDGIIRTTFLINEAGIIIHRIDKPKTKIHGEELLEIIKKVERK